MKNNLIKTPLVTVYITNHNYGKYLSKSIKSVLNQSLKDFELIIIDDGSIDNSKEILKKYEKNKKIKIIFQKNKGLIVSNNLALRLAKGKYILRLDADDWLDPHALEIMSSILEKNSKLRRFMVMILILTLTFIKITVLKSVVQLKISFLKLIY